MELGFLNSANKCIFKYRKDYYTSAQEVESGETYYYGNTVRIYSYIDIIDNY